MTQNTSPEKAQGGRIRKTFIRLAVLLFLGATGVVLYNMGHIQAWLHDINRARAWVLQHGLWETSLIFFAANTVLCAFGCPRLWTSAFAGIVFGGPLGFCISLPSSIAGAHLTFTFARSIGSRRLIARATAKWKGAVVLNASPGVFQTALIRQLPIPGMVSTLLLATSNISRPVFIIGSTLGFIPGAIVACFLSDTFTTAQTQESIAFAAAIILIALGVMTILRKKG